MSYRLALDVGSRRSALALVDGSQPAVLAYERLDTPEMLAAGVTAAQSLAVALSAFLDAHRIETNEVIGVGVGVPGATEHRHGVVLNCPNLPELNGLSLAPDLAREMDLPTVLENNANLMALGEFAAMHDPKPRCLALVSVSSGLGSGLILDGQIYHSASGATMELGHTVVIPGGLSCTCGGHGCLEAYCSGRALAEEAERLYGQVNGHSADAATLIERAHTGDEAAQAALGRAFDLLGAALANLINLVNPERIVLAGHIVLAWEAGAEQAREVALRQALPAQHRSVQIEVSQLEPHAGVLGAAALVTQFLKTGPGPA